jgi:heme exporter protein D
MSEVAAPALAPDPPASASDFTALSTGRVWFYVFVSLLFLLLAYIVNFVVQDKQHHHRIRDQHALEERIKHARSLANRLPHGHATRVGQRLRRHVYPNAEPPKDDI